MKRTYEAPAMSRLGDIREVTQGILGFGCSDAVFGKRGEGVLACLVPDDGGT